MSRYKFRVWVKRSKEMLSDIHDSAMPCLMADGRMYVEYESKDVTDDVILMFSTGISDNNGDDVYEGDIVESKIFKAPIRGVVKWSHEFAEFYAHWPNHMELHLTQWEPRVIGNIHANPELLEQ